MRCKLKYFQKPDLSLWAFEDDGSQDYLITPDMTPVAPPLPPDPPTQAEIALAQIRELERQHADNQARMTRVSLLALAIDKARSIATVQMTALANAEADTLQLDANARAALIAQYLAQLTDAYLHVQLMALNSGYKVMFELEQQIEVLRDLL
jgi:hypothetical protein